MMSIQQMLESSITIALGWTLLHFLWQATLIGFVTWVVLACARLASSKTRYGVACLALLSMVLFSAGTFVSQLENVNATATPATVQASKSKVELNRSTHSANAAKPLANNGIESNNDDVESQPSNAWIAPNSPTAKSLLPWMVVAWVIGVVCLLIRLFLGMLRIYRWRFEAFETSNKSLHECVARLKKQISLKRSLVVLESARAIPAVIGWLRPVLLVPSSMLSSLTPGELEAIILHELAHVKRHDFIVNVMQVMVETVFFFHPAVWFVTRQIRVEREYCCDDVAVEASGDRVGFAKALARMEEIRCDETLAMAANGGGGMLVTRIQRLLTGRSSRVQPRVSLSTLCCFFAGTLLFVLATNSELPIASATSPASTENHVVSSASLLEPSNHLSLDDDDEVVDLPKVRIDEKDGDEIRRVYLLSRGKLRTAAAMLQHCRWSFEKSSSLHGRSVTNMESVVSAVRAKIDGSQLTSKEIGFSLPEDSGTQCIITGSNIEISEKKKFVHLKIKDGKIEWIDPVGVVRATATVADGKAPLDVKCDIGNGEVVLSIKADGSDIKVVLNVESGAPADEKDPPHGGIRYELFGEDEEEVKPARLKMMWRYELRRLAQEAEAETDKHWTELIYGEKFESDEDKKIDNETSSGKPWSVNGTVTDKEGRPLAGVTVRAHTGIGSLRETGSAITGKDGTYAFKFGPGIFGENRKLIQAATITASLEGHFERNLCRQGDRGATFETPDRGEGWGEGKAKDLFLPDQPQTIDFTMRPAARLKGTVFSGSEKFASYTVSLTGKDLPPSCSVVATVRTDKQGRFQLDDIPTGFAYQILISSPRTKEKRSVSWASPPINFRSPHENIETRIRYDSEVEGVDFGFQQMHVFLNGKGNRNKDALKKSYDEELFFKWDGLSTPKMIRAGIASIELGK